MDERENAGIENTSDWAILTSQSAIKQLVKGHGF